MPKVPRPTRPMADVNVLPQADGSNKIVVCFMPDPDDLGEGVKAGLCIDASRSMKASFEDKETFPPTNHVQGVARKLGQILCDVSHNGKVSMLYWALNLGGDTEEIGELDSAGCTSADISGPKQQKMGRGTELLPAIRYVVETVAEGADFTFGVIITDGRIDDEQGCIDYCMQLGELIANNQHPQVKFILIGVGDLVDQEQLERFDDMCEDTALEDVVDLFSSGQVANMRDEGDILGVLFGELMNEDTMFDAAGSVLDGGGNELAKYADGFPGKLSFTLPKGDTSFTIKLQTKGDITQDISAALAP